MKMKLLFHISCLLFLNICSLLAQNIESLKAELGKAKEDTHKVNILINICFQNGAIDPSQKKKYAENALQLAKKNNYQRGIMIAELLLGISESNTGKYDESLKYLDTALRMCLENPNDKLILSRIYNAIGGTYYYKSDYSIALPYYLKSLALDEELKNKKRIAGVESNIAWIYYQTNQSKMALEYATKAIAIRKQFKDSVQLSAALSLLADIYVQLQDYKMALDCFKQSLEITEKLKDKSYSLTNLMGIGDALNDTKKYAEALIYYKRSLEIAREIDDEQNISYCTIYLGYEYTKTGKFLEGVALLKQAVDFSRKIGAKMMITNAYSCLSEAFEKEKNFKEALKYSKLYNELSDSIYNAENSRQINGLSAKYESEKKEKEIAVLNANIQSKQKDQEILNARIDEKNSIIIVTAIGAVLLIISAFLFFSRQQLKQKNKYQIEINMQQENTAIAIIQAQENERNRISRDLHDGMGTFLSTLKINLESFESSIPADKTAQYKNISQLVDKTATELRSIMKNLSSETLQENGLEGALQELIESVNRLGLIRFHFLSHGLAKRLDSIIEINLYRVAQELLNNCLKHAHATQATLQLIDHGSIVLLMMEDNGKGFDPKDLKQGDNYRMGLKNIRNRISFINGTLKTESTLGKGSTFIIEIPKQST